MLKEHKKLYKAGKKWLTATITVVSFALLGEANAQKAQADTTNTQIDNQQVSTTVNDQANQSINSNKVSLNSGSRVSQSNNSETQLSQSSISNTPNTSIQNNSVKPSNQTKNVNNQNIAPQAVTTAKNATSSVNDGLDPTIYGTVNVKDWDYQENNNILKLTGYHGQNTRRIIIPNLNDFQNNGINVGNNNSVGITSELVKKLASNSLALAISKTTGKYSDTVVATDSNWAETFEETGLLNLDLTNLNTHNITNMNNLFLGESTLHTVGDLSHWDTSNVTDMGNLFYHDSQLRDVGNLSHWDTSKVTNMDSMFLGAVMNPGDLGHWDTSSVTNMGYMFLGAVMNPGDLSHWDTSNVINMSYMFWDSSLGNIGDITKWNVNKVKDMNNMFGNSGQKFIIIANNNEAVIPNQAVIEDNTGKVLATVDTPTIYHEGSVKSTVDKLIQNKVDSLNKNKNLDFYYGNPHIASSTPDNDYGYANATFIVDIIQNAKTGLINYVDQSGKVIKTDQISGQIGSTVTIHVALPDGYELADPNETIPSSVNVTKDGIQAITITVKKKAVTPATKTGSINYVDQNGNVIKTDQISGQVGSTVAIHVSLPDDYELADPNENIPTSITITDNNNLITVYVKRVKGQPGWHYQNGSWYYFKQDGTAQTGWQQINGHWYYFDPTNARANKGWFQTQAGNWYYFDPTNAWALTGLQQINGHWYYFDQNNAWANKGWQQINGHWYYFDSTNTWALTGWQQINGHWYYFDPTNTWADKGWFQTQAGNWYYFDPTNAWALTGWQWINGHWYYFDYANAWALKGWQRINGNWYYFDPTNTWMDTGWQKINGRNYYFNASGVWSNPRSVYWNSTKQSKLTQFIQSYNSSHGTAFTWVAPRYYTTGIMVVNGNPKLLNNEGIPEGGTQSVGFSSNGRGSYAYNIVAAYNQNFRTSYNSPIGEWHNTYYFAYHNGQPVVLFDYMTNGYPTPSDEQHLSNDAASRATALAEFTNAFVTIANN